MKTPDHTFRGAGKKFLLEITAPGFSMHEDNFTVTLRQGKTVKTFQKTDLVEDTVIIKGSSMNDLAYSAHKYGLDHYLVYNNTQQTKQSFTAATFTTGYNLMVGNLIEAGSIKQGFEGYIYYLNFGSQRSFVPAEVNSVAGLYDTYNDVFYPSMTNTAFIAGPVRNAA